MQADAAGAANVRRRMNRLWLAAACLVALLAPLAPLGAAGTRYRYYDDAGTRALRVDRWTGQRAVLQCVDILPPGAAVPVALPVPDRRSAARDRAGAAPGAAAAASRRCAWSAARR
jgi:hypothetical protein